jgi:histidinol-phosphatase (PHP family)
VLTDYHVHLRPDDEDTPPSRYFTAANAERFREAADERGIAELGVSEHIHRFQQSLEVWQHPWWRKWATDDVEAYCGFVREETDLRLGIEADYVSGREGRIARFLDAREWDYVIGSVHFVRDAAVDLEGDAWDHVWGRGERPDTIWERYFLTLAEAARSGLYDVMAHPDLVKVWGSARPAPERDPRRYYEPAVEAMLEAGVAMEVSTAGLRKPVGEIYPARALLDMAVDAGLAIALSSDAHLPEHVGFGYDRALELLADAGVSELCVFEGRQRRMEPIG